MQLFVKWKVQRGVSLLLSLMMVSLIVLLVVFVTAISTGQLRFAGSSTDSSRAFSAADAGIEYALSRINLGLPVGQNAASCKCDGVTWCPSSPTLASNAEYCVTADNPTTPRKITAVGRTTDTKIRRSLEVLVPTFAAVNAFATFCTNGVSTLNLNTFCTTNVYAGATGLISTNPGTCAMNAIGSSFVLSNLARTDVTLNTLSGNYYIVQCYK